MRNKEPGVFSRYESAAMLYLEITDLFNLVVIMWPHTERDFSFCVLVPVCVCASVRVYMCACVRAYVCLCECVCVYVCLRV